MLRLPEPEGVSLSARPPARASGGAQAASAEPSARSANRRRSLLTVLPDPAPQAADGADAAIPIAAAATPAQELRPRPRPRRPAANPLLRRDAEAGGAGAGSDRDAGVGFGPDMSTGSVGPATPGGADTGPRGRRAIPVAPASTPALHAECYACPVGSAFAAVRGAPPETLDHLLAASREFVAAIRSAMEVVEHTLDRPARGGAGRTRRGRVQRVTLD